MAKKQPLMTLSLPLYEMEDVQRMMNAIKALDLGGGTDLLEKAVEEYLSNHGF
jgi:hypothetical protein